ncbi:MAG: aminotransferase class I and II [Bacteroides sp.]|nr:aminotransferase class I and II [Bacteroides sp.]
MMRRQKVTRYICPLREGGSLPALAEADDGFKYVVKFRGAGHGVKALIAELIGGEVARKLGLAVPELVLLDIDERFGITEGDEEIQDLLKASRGLNLGMHYLSGSLTMDPYVNKVDSKLASRIVWLDAFLTNVDRTAMNTNMLVWHTNETWLIDHGASFYFHHSWRDLDKAPLVPFDNIISRHSLLHKASLLKEVDEENHKILTENDFAEIVALIPSDWLQWSEEVGMTEDEVRKTYLDFLVNRFNNSSIFVNAAINVRKRSLV